MSTENDILFFTHCFVEVATMKILKILRIFFSFRIQLWILFHFVTWHLKTKGQNFPQAEYKNRLFIYKREGLSNISIVLVDGVVIQALLIRRGKKYNFGDVLSYSWQEL